MRDCAEQVKGLRECASGNFDICVKCGLKPSGLCSGVVSARMNSAADAIEELLAASPPKLWTDEPIEGTGFMTHTLGGGKGFEIHFRTDSLEKYKAVQEECRRQIDHAKTEPPKEVE